MINRIRLRINRLLGATPLSTVSALSSVSALSAVSAVGLAIGSLALGASDARAETWPDRPISIIVAFGAGGVTDTLSRMIGQHLSERLKVPVIVENKPGANQIVGIRYLASKPADGYTLYTGTGSSLAQNPGVRKNIGYDPVKDFQPVAMLGVQAGVIAVSPKTAANSLKEFIDYAKKNPGKLNYGSQGVGSAGHLAAEVFLSRAGLEMVHIPHKSDNDLSIELSESRIDVAFMTPKIAVPMAESGRMKILSVTSVERLPFLPDLPSLKETGVAALADLDPFTFYGLVAAKGTPPAIVARVNKEVNEILAMPAVEKQMRENYKVEPRPLSVDGMESFLQKELTKWTEIGKKVKVD